MPTAAKNVLVLGRGTRAFLSVIRSLGRAGLAVHVGMCPDDDLALKSRYVRKHHRLPEFEPRNEAWISAMEELLASTRFELVLGCNDHAVIPLQIHKDRLGRLARICALGERAFRIAFDKIESFSLAQELGICQPRSRIETCTAPAEEVLAGLSLPVVLKPPSSFTADELSQKRVVARCRTPEELSKQLRKATAWNKVLVQENFNGRGVGVELLASEGETLVAFQHERVHEPLEGGGSSYRKSVALDPDLLAASKALMKALDYTGVAMVEFKRNPQSGEWVFIEINGRFWGSLPLALAAGVDFPLYLYQMLVDGRKDFPRKYKLGIHCRNVAADCRWMMANLAANRKDPVLATRPLASVAMEAFNVVALRERWDTLTLDDPLPGLAEGAAGIGELFSKAARKVKHKLASTSLARKRACARLVAKTRTAHTMLFVCKGNICRSPFAQHVASKLLGSHCEILSGGYYPVPDRPSPAAAVEAASEFGVDLGEHKSTVLNEELIARADVILVFDEHNETTLLATYPSAAEKVFRLGAFLSRGPLAIDDPWGHDVAYFRSVYTRIAQAIERFAGELDEGRTTSPTSRQPQIAPETTSAAS